MSLLQFVVSNRLISHNRLGAIGIWGKINQTNLVTFGSTVLCGTHVQIQRYSTLVTTHWANTSAAVTSCGQLALWCLQFTAFQSGAIFTVTGYLHIKVCNVRFLIKFDIGNISSPCWIFCPTNVCSIPVFILFGNARFSNKGSRCHGQGEVSSCGACINCIQWHFKDCFRHAPVAAVVAIRKRINISRAILFRWHLINASTKPKAGLPQ